MRNRRNSLSSVLQNFKTLIYFKFVSFIRCSSFLANPSNLEVVLRKTEQLFPALFAPEKFGSCVKSEQAANAETAAVHFAGNEERGESPQTDAITPECTNLTCNKF